jgi:glycosyltransferase involved in cell wall biosynthesis
VPARDAEALATALERLLRDRALRRSMGLRSRAIVEKEYSMQHVIEATLAAYRDVLRGAA